MDHHEDAGAPGVTEASGFQQRVPADQQLLTDFLTGFARVLEEDLSRPGETRVWCAVTVLGGGRAETIAASNDRALSLDQLQLRFPDGPCLASAREHVLVHTGDTRTDHR
ncbi:hypothetical protein AS188_07885 [Kocuria flava]|uniref:Uncharacterized protein n=2 Tax=Kocuria TaxID=57493 RepID=A0A0U3H9Q7_9MICC|nr:MULTISPECIES: hypothetical protein [Kocuria]ALU39685.1 hypothetical protein AS188_07885 [Kocuria flava]GEO92295.1 hypothetical protein KFL01_16010 [Kocuria flava]GEO97257.1 hypothetical protein KTU01_33800 [Kocuria turfanensis]